MGAEVFFAGEGVENNGGSGKRGDFDANLHSIFERR
jgi:hypothetical protein